jgi:hypothetical protein
LNAKRRLVNWCPSNFSRVKNKIKCLFLPHPNAKLQTN